MESYTVLESYDLKFCCVCTQNSSSLYLNVFDNVISFHSKYISLQEIIKETMNVKSFQDQFVADSHECLCRFNKTFLSCMTSAWTAKPESWNSSYSSDEPKKLDRSSRTHRRRCLQFRIYFFKWWIILPPTRKKLSTRSLKVRWRRNFSTRTTLSRKTM